VEHDVRATRQAVDECGVADVALVDLDALAAHGAREVLAAAADEVVDDDDAGGACFERLVGDVGADEAGAAGDEDAGAVEVGLTSPLHP